MTPEMEAHSGVRNLRVLQKRRVDVLAQHNGGDSPEEDAVLDAMDAAWWALTDEERTYCAQPGPYHEETLQWLDKGAA